MTEIVNKEEFMLRKREFTEEIKAGAVFIYPTDTIYGIGCNAQLKESVEKVRKAKKRYDQPFSVIAPSKEWIRENCIVSEEAEKWVEKLPGPYTLILKLKKKKCIAENVNNRLDTLGVRIPNHWFSNIVSGINAPIITTSANVKGEPFMTNIDDLDTEIKYKIEFIVYEGERKGRPSTLVDLSGKEVKETRR